MQKTSPLIRTKLRLPFIRPGLVPRPRLQELVAQGLRGPLTLITAPAGFGKTTLVASCIAGCGMPVAWLSLDKNDNQVERFLNYLVAALQEADQAIGSEAAQLLATSPQAPPETILTSLINDLDTTGRPIIMVLDDYQFISSQAVHEAVAFLLEHCPLTFHLLIATRSDPPLPLARLRARSLASELRAVDLRFTETEAAQFLNDVMGLHLDSKSVEMLAERTEGWIAGLQMAAITIKSTLSMRDREDVLGFIEGFSGTNRYILDYLLEEVLASQPPEIQRFLLLTSILERLTAPLCEAVLEVEELEGWILDRLSATFQPSSLPTYQQILEYLERANLFLVPLDDERQWYRYHHLFADLLRARLDQIYPGLGSQLHIRAAAWFEQYGSILEAIQHASMAPDDDMVERLIEQHYIEMMNHGEMAWIRSWMGKLSKELVYRRPWLCLYEAASRSWFGQLEEANLLLDAAEKHFRSEGSAPDIQSMQGYHAYVKSRVTAMQGNTDRAIELCRTARVIIPKDNLGLQIDVSITLGYEYFLYGDFVNAQKILLEMIQQGYDARAINNPVAGYAVLARMYVFQGRLHDAFDLLQKAELLTHEASGQYLGVIGLVDVGIAALSCEWNHLEAALVRLKQGLDFLPLWGKTDDLCLAYITLSRIQLAQGKLHDAAGAIEKAAQLIQTCGVFTEARSVIESAQVKMWMVQGDWLAIDRWTAALEKRLGTNDAIRYEDELTHLTLARVFIAQKKLDEANRLLARLEETARSAGRTGRLIEIMLLKALALQASGEAAQADVALTKSLALAEPEGYLRIFLDEGTPMKMLLAQWLTLASAGPLREYAIHLLSQFDAEPDTGMEAQVKKSPAGEQGKAEVRAAQEILVEPLSPRELEVLQHIALGRTNQGIARQLIVSPGTVKAHTSSIYRKLDVANRTEAVARARQLGLLS